MSLFTSRYLQVGQIPGQLSLQSRLAAMAQEATQAEDEEPPPPPSPPRPKVERLPPNWKSAKDSEGKMYYYHSVTRYMYV